MTGNGSSLSQMKVVTQTTTNGQTTTATHTLDFTYDASGSPMAVTYDGTTYYYALNLQGDVLAILDGSGNRAVYYVYDAWGYEKSCTGTMASTLGHYNPLRYRGYVYDTETKLCYLQSRYYNPGLGRFINADAFTSTGQGILGNNMFAYCRNNPVSRIDISGSADTPVEEELDDDVEVTPPVPDAAGGGNGSGISAGSTGNGGSGPSGFTVASSGSTNTVIGGSTAIPKEAFDTREYIKTHNGSPPPGYKGGRQFSNDGRNGGQILPSQYGPFYEYDIYPMTRGMGRGSERIVMGNGVSWYTPDHYMTFFEME